MKGGIVRILVAASALVGCGLRVEVLSDRTVEPIVDGGADTATESDAPVFDAPAGTGTWIATGQYHACAIRAGLLSCWGDGHGGALGLGDETDRSRPSLVPAAGPWAEVSGGEHHTCARTDGGELWCFGQNARGQLGVLDLAARRSPSKVALDRAVRSVSAGYETTCAIAVDGSLWCWGENLEGQLGRDDGYPGSPSPRPLRVGTGEDWIRVSAGQGHVCGIRAPGTLWCWGRNPDGQLGLGAGTPIQIRTPTRVGAASDWVDVDVGQDTSCGLRSDGSIWCWGVNAFGQVGASPSGPVYAPRRVGLDADWAEVRTDTFSTCARKTNGSLWCWGRNVEGQLGLGDIVDRATPTRVGTGTDWVQVDVGRFHACARRGDGTVLCTGENDAGQLGVGDGARRDVLTPVVSLGGAS